MNEFYKNFRNQLLTASLVGLVIAVSSSVNAANFEFNLFGTASVYVGAGLGYNKYLISKDLSSIIQSPPNQGKIKSTSCNLLVPLIGIQIDNKYGLEAGYSIHNKLNFSGANSGSLRIRNYFVDLMGYVPLPIQAYPIDLIAGAGIGRMNIKEKSSLGVIQGGSYNKFGFRVKGGAQYIIDSNFSVRGLVAYQRVGDRGIKHAIKTMRSINLDLIYLI